MSARRIFLFLGMTHFLITTNRRAHACQPQHTHTRTHKNQKKKNVKRWTTKKELCGCCCCCFVSTTIKTAQAPIKKKFIAFSLQSLGEREQESGEWRRRWTIQHLPTTHCLTRRRSIRKASSQYSAQEVDRCVERVCMRWWLWLSCGLCASHFHATLKICFSFSLFMTNDITENFDNLNSPVSLPSWPIISVWMLGTRLKKTSNTSKPMTLRIEKIGCSPQTRHIVYSLNFPWNANAVRSFLHFGFRRRQNNCVFVKTNYFIFAFTRSGDFPVHPTPTPHRGDSQFWNGFKIAATHCDLRINLMCALRRTMDAMALTMKYRRSRIHSVDTSLF